ncbi:MAG TPA: acyltransferase [Pirellulaceae bacterium]|nr:acyltransferase [Pirellulaceae bacterium]HMO93221.1 acyltransferase [Pirellulaceae bacterium]HMP70052.1 acyltransferase [Pirellulaceae bacterium]
MIAAEKQSELSRNGTSRIFELDALRALAAINLMLFHFTHYYQTKYGYIGELGFEMPYGKYGVQLFFMLSGYVNAMTLLRRQQPGDFLVNRLLRIFPSFWLMLVLNVFLVLVTPIAFSGMTLDAILFNATALPNAFGYDTIEPVTWTLQVELFFYLILLAMFLTGSFLRPLPTIMLYLLLSFVGCLAIDSIQENDAATWAAGVAHVMRSALILDYFPLFAMGILLHEIVSNRGRALHNWGVMFLSVLVFHAVDRHEHNPLVTAAFIALLAASAYGKVPLLRKRPFVFFASISYALYLFHNNLGCSIIHALNHRGLSPILSMSIAIAFVVTFAAAYTFWIERPLTRKLKSMWKRVVAPASIPGQDVQAPTASKINV